MAVSSVPVGCSTRTWRPQAQAGRFLQPDAGWCLATGAAATTGVLRSTCKMLGSRGEHLP